MNYEAETTQAAGERQGEPQRELLRVVLAAIDLPDPVDADGRDARLELLDLRAAFILGYLDGGSSDRTAERLAEALEHHHPIGYATDGGESR